MALTPSKINMFTFMNLPSAWWCGVRLKYIDDKKAMTTVKLKWMNQNPFKSMFWAVQGMAAELSTGALVMNEIQKSGKKVSMLVANNKATFTKSRVPREIQPKNPNSVLSEGFRDTIVFLLSAAARARKSLQKP